MANEKRKFPMQDGPREIPWEIAEQIYEKYSDLWGKHQTLERLAERGGFTWKEVSFIYEEHRRRCYRSRG